MLAGRSALKGLLIAAVAGIWLLAVFSISTRIHFVIDYSTLVVAPPQIEPFIPAALTGVFAISMLATWVLLYLQATRVAENQLWIRLAIGFIALACLPQLVLSLLASCEILAVPRLYWEPVWLAAWSSVSFACLLVRRDVALGHEPPDDGAGTIPQAATVISCISAGIWWYAQSVHYFRNFLLGYNDFGHFARRIANTAAGNGVLLETPALPIFWDHFNPGLLLLLPLWQLWPSPHLFFFLQASCLSATGLLVFWLGQKCGLRRWTACLWSAAWLVQPIVGQMNLAYTYGWHPISLAIPLFFGSLLALHDKRHRLATALLIAAMSMEEGAIVVVALFSAGCALQAWNQSRIQGVACEVIHVSFLTWTFWAISSSILFLAVFRYSGMAEFQTGRFITLGHNTLEIVLSPVLRPSAFWGELLQFRKLAFIASLLLPCGALGLASGWRWLIPTLLPLGVLLVWDHQPAASIAFQYTSVLLPIFWFATLRGAAAFQTALPNYRLDNALAASTLVCGATLSLFIGQLPYSRPSLFDVQARTYAADSPVRRGAQSRDGIWLAKQVAVAREDGRSVLATGRIAAHLIANADVETVGQFIERREFLAAMDPEAGDPLNHYHWILLDRIESFQQTKEQTAEIERDALRIGFQVVDDRFEFVILKRPE